LLDEYGLRWRQLSAGPDGPVLLVAAEDRKRAAALLAREFLPLRGQAGAPPEAFLFYERDSDRWLILRTVTDAAGPAGSLASPPAAINLAGRGLSVALLAPDGAGKSTLARALASYPSLPVWTAYLGLYPRSERRFAVPGVGFCVRVVRQWTHYLLARWHQARGMIVVFDRYPYDARLRPRRSGGRHDRLRRWLLGHVLPPPDLAIVLDAPAEVLRGRKDEQDIEELRRQRHEYLSLAGRLPCRTIVVDAGRSESDVRREVTDLIWQECVARSGRPAVRRARGG
jgi:thymidylate kinase